MSRKKLGFVALLLVIALGCGGGAMWWGLVQVPDFYEEALVVEKDPVVRKAAARKFVQRTIRLAEEIRRADEWSQEFEQDHVNSYLAEDLEDDLRKLIPPGVSDPRVRFLAGEIQVGFRLERENFNGIVSLRVRPSVPEPNQLAIEVESVRAGVVPIPIDNMLTNIARHFARRGWHVEWREANGNDVLVVFLDRGETHQPVLEQLEVLDGKVRVYGRKNTAQGKLAADEPAEAESPEGVVPASYIRVAEKSSPSRSAQ